MITKTKMCDSDDPGDNEPLGMDLTGFLFGNIDESGQLEDDGLLDGESKRMLSSLSRLGLGSMLSEVLEETEAAREEEDKGSFISYSGLSHVNSFHIIRNCIKYLHNILEPRIYVINGVSVLVFLKPCKSFLQHRT